MKLGSILKLTPYCKYFIEIKYSLLVRFSMENMVFFLRSGYLYGTVNEFLWTIFTVDSAAHAH